jgi:hypothetical protein
MGVRVDLFALPAGEVVQGPDLVTRLDIGIHDVGSDEAGTASNQNSHLINRLC